MSDPQAIDGVLVQWGDRLFYPGNRIVHAKGDPRLRRRGLAERAAAIRARIEATVVRRAPQVMVKVTGGGRGMKAIAAHFRYISKHGRLEIELSEAFTIHDRADAEDLMGIAREELGLAATKQRFPLKGTCLSIYSRCVNSEAPLRRVLDDVFPWCAAWEDEPKRLFSAYVQAKQAQQVLDYDDLLLYCAGAMAEPSLAAHIGARFAQATTRSSC
jgi:superfamily I DNA/RNA helicase